MDKCIEEIFGIIDISYQTLDNNELLIERDIFLSNIKYNFIREKIPELKNFFSSSFLTSLQKNANIKQKWPLFNLIRQILKKNNFIMVPIRKANGYNNEGKKLFKRFFIIKKSNI